MSNAAASRRGSPQWMSDALCARSTHPEWWFPTDGQAPTALAIEVCSRCPVRTECLDYAILNQIDAGIWGGQSARGRRIIARSRSVDS